MSTNDVPGANLSNGDVLATGAWAEHEDGSLIFVEGTEGGRVIYSMFDVGSGSPIEYRDAMTEINFKKAFSWSIKTSIAGIKWTWHDKTPFPWNRIIKVGFSDGPRFSSADHVMTAAARVAESLNLRAQALDGDVSHRQDDVRVGGIWSKLSRALGRLK